MGIIRHSIIAPVAMPAVNFCVDTLSGHLMSLGSKDSSEAPSVAAGDEEKGLFEQLRERQQEHQAEGFFARKIRAFKAYLKKCDRVVGEKLPEIADKIIEYSSDYEALRQEYPNSTLITEKGASVALQAVTGIGLGKAILQEAGMDVVNFAIGDAVGEQFEKVVNFGAGKLKEKYPHLSEEQSKALVGMSVLAGFVAKDGAAAFHNLSNMLAPKPRFAVAGMRNLGEVHISNPSHLQEGHIFLKENKGAGGTRVNTHIPQPTKLVVDGKQAFYADAPYHHINSAGPIKGKSPTRGAEMLEESVLVKPKTTTRRIAVDKINNEIVVFDLTLVSPGSVEYHGHIKAWSTITDDKIKSFLIKNNMVDSKGRIVK
jgi:hypothetical protein